MHVFTCGQLSAAAHAVGGEVCFEDELPGDLPVLHGEQAVQSLDNGLVLYLSRSEDLVDGSSRNILAPGITAAFLLDGQADVSLASRRWHFDARHNRQRAMLVNLTDSDQFCRHWQSGRQETKVCLGFSSAWFEQFVHDSSLCGSRLQRFSREHLQTLPWQPSPGILQRARELTTRATPLIQRMQRESFALDLATDILQCIEAPPRHKRLSAHLSQCLERLKEWLDSGEANHLSISQMARALGSNPVDLQNGFRQLNGITIAAYLRSARLEQAYQAIRQQSLSVDDAASLAGYEHVSSFSAAFKKQYGVPPSQARV